MSISRLRELRGIGVDQMGALADRLTDTNILRLENLDIDIPPHPDVLERTRRTVDMDSANSYLPFVGSDELRQTVTTFVSGFSGVEYDWQRSTIITAGGLNGLLNVLLALIEPGDEVIVPDPCYIGFINRIRLAGGVPVFLPFIVRDGVWRVNLDVLDSLISNRTKIFLMMSPVMPTGAVLRRDEWEYIADRCRRANAWMLYNSVMHHVLYDGLQPFSPAAIPGMAERTIIIGAVSKEQRMIGWRIGWIVAPPDIINDIGLVCISNVVCPVGVAQSAAALAIRLFKDEVASLCTTLQERRDSILHELSGLPIIKPEGGWSMLFDVQEMGLNGAEASKLLLEYGDIAATAMTGWGSRQSDGFIRFVFSNESVQRFLGFRERIEQSLFHKK